MYGFECVTLVRKDALVIARIWFSAWTVRCPSGLFGSQERGLILSNPVPPLGTTLLAQAWPFSPAPEGVHGYAALTIHPEGRTREDGPFVAWDDAHGVAADDKALRAGSAELGRADTDAGAGYWAGMLREWAKARPEDRAEALARALDRSLDRAIALRRALDLDEAGRWTRRIGIVLWLHLFVAVPAVVAAWGIVFTWPILAAVMLVLMWINAGLLWLAHARLYPADGGDRAKAVFQAVVWPPAAIRAVDYLARPAMAGLHPLAVAHALLAADAFKAHARKVLLDARTPLRPECRSEDPRARAAEAWYRDRLKAALEKFVRSQGIDPDALCAAPAPKDGTSRSFCPRCDAQYTLRDGTCSTCGAIELQPLAPFVEPLPTGPA